MSVRLRAICVIQRLSGCGVMPAMWTNREGMSTKNQNVMCDKALECIHLDAQKSVVVRHSQWPFMERLHAVTDRRRRRAEFATD
jgi:hypothetical protein